MICVYEIVHNGSKAGGAKTFDRVRSQIEAFCPELKAYLHSHPSQYSVIIRALKSDELVTTYMQKESELKYYRLPTDHFELVPYFADLQKAKPKNPDLDT
jgi:hypothetical protein